MTKIKIIITTLFITALAILLYINHLITGQLLIVLIICASVVVFIAFDLATLDTGPDARVSLISSRIKSLLLGLLFLSVTLYGGWWFIYDDMHESYCLQIHGKQSIGDVIKYEFKRKRGRRGRTRYQYIHTIVYDGHQDEFFLRKEYSIGSKFYILYLLDSPEISRIVKPDRTLFSMLFFRFSVILGLILVIVFGFLSSIHLKEFIKPSSD